MRGGVLRHRVTIQRPVTGVDDWGQPLDGWVDLEANVPAEVRDIRGREFWSGAQAPAGDVTVRVRVRFRTDVTRQMRIVGEACALQIEAVIDPDGKRTELHLMCLELS